MMDEQRLDEILLDGLGHATLNPDVLKAKAAIQALYKDSLREELQVVHDTFNSDEMQHNDVGFDKWLDDWLAQLNRKEP